MLYKTFFLQALVAQSMVMWKSANDPRTNDPQIGPEMITERMWSSYWTANDPDQKLRNGIDGEVVWIRNWCESKRDYYFFYY